ncbi:MAG: DUF3015 family protein [Bacteriovoracaceae bacterium]|nr:DUF3015 family protein [Bacteriovoracaceae bacterium]
MKMNSNKSILMLAMSCLFTLGFAQAAPYGAAGCGLGSQIFTKKDNQVLPATTNAISTQTFSITSGTFNCVSNMEREAKVRNFIEANKVAVMNEAAKGAGNSLSSLASFYGCDAKTFGLEIQKNFSTIFDAQETASNSEMDSIMGGLKSVFNDSKELHASCWFGA